MSTCKQLQTRKVILIIATTITGMYTRLLKQCFWPYMVGMCMAYRCSNINLPSPTLYHGSCQYHLDRSYIMKHGWKKFVNSSASKSPTLGTYPPMPLVFRMYQEPMSRRRSMQLTLPARCHHNPNSSRLIVNYY